MDSPASHCYRSVGFTQFSFPPLKLDKKRRMMRLCLSSRIVSTCIGHLSSGFGVLVTLRYESRGCVTLQDWASSYLKRHPRTATGTLTDKPHRMVPTNQWAYGKKPRLYMLTRRKTTYRDTNQADRLRSLPYLGIEWMYLYPIQS